jgi:hypothetical protein
MKDDDDYLEEAEREMERARSEDNRRGQLLPLRDRGRKSTVASVPPQVPLAEKVLTCCICGFASSTHRGFRVDPEAKRGIVCAGRYDETGAPIDCFDRLDRAYAVRLGEEVAETRRRIREAKERAAEERRGPRGGFEQ